MFLHGLCLSSYLLAPAQFPTLTSFSDGLCDPGVINEINTFLPSCFCSWSFITPVEANEDFPSQRSVYTLSLFHNFCWLNRKFLEDIQNHHRDLQSLRVNSVFEDTWRLQFSTVLLTRLLHRPKTLSFLPSALHAIPIANPF